MSREFLAIIDECYAERSDNTLDNIDDQVIDVLLLFLIEYMSYEKDGRQHKLWHLMGKPITDDKEKHDCWLTLI